VLAQSPQFGGNKLLHFLKYIILIAIFFRLQMGEHEATHGWLCSGEDIASPVPFCAAFRDSAIPGVQLFKEKS
jgi:hypothetical protein